MDKKAFKTAAVYVADKTGKSYVSVMLDMIFCGIRYQAGYNDYIEFEFYNMKGKKRATYLTRGKNNRIVKRYNNQIYRAILDDKANFNQMFDSYLHRDWLDLNKASYNDFCQFVKEHPHFVGKVIDGEGGVGINIYNAEVSGELYNRLKECSQMLVEECIVQHSEMNRLYGGSVNTLRIFTFCRDGQVYFLNGILKIGNGSVVDNFSSGGMYAFLNDDGVVDTPAIDKADKEYAVHPLTQTPILGFHVPMFSEAVSLVKQAHLKLPQVGYIGWDVAIGKNRPMIVEGNFYPGIFQKKSSYSRTGLLPRYKQYMKI